MKKRKKNGSEGRPKVSRQLVVLKLTTDQVDFLVALWAGPRKKLLLDHEMYEDVGMAIDAQVQLAKVQKTYRICVHRLRVSRAGKPKRLACSLCEKRVEEGKPSLWGTERTERAR